MMFSIIILLLVGLIAFFHYVQGLFSATLSAFIAVIAAVLSVSYHETVVNSLLKGKVSDEADAMVLCVLFAAIYIILRLIFDAAVPGNVRFPTLMDKIGSAVMGIIAGIFTTGIFALAAQALPFGPAIGMYSRYPLKDTQGVTYPTERQQVDSFIYDEVDSENLDPAKEKSLLIPVDDMLLATVQSASNGGALSGTITLNQTHPDYPLELFGNRLGIQLGGKHTALNLGGLQQVQLMDMFSVPALATSDPEFSQLRKARKIDPIERPKPNQLLLIVRLKVDHTAGDDADGLFRFSMGSIRLVANGKDYFPIGTVDNANVLYMQKPDDFIFIDLKTNTEGAVDAAFLVDKTDVLSNGGKTAAGAQPTMDDGVFIEVKRLAQIDLSGKSISSGYSASPTVAVMRKKLSLDGSKRTVAVVPATPSAAFSTPSTPSTPAPAPSAPSGAKLPVAAKSLKSSSQITHKIGVSTADVDAQNVAVAGGTISLKDSKLAKVAIEPTETLAKLATGDNQLTDLYVPAGKQMVQLNGNRPGSDSWSWVGELGSLELVDASNNRYGLSGFFTVVTEGEKTGLLMHYDADQPVTSATPAAGKAGVVTYLFLVPSGTQLKQISAGGQQGDVDLTVP